MMPWCNWGDPAVESTDFRLVNPEIVNQWIPASYKMRNQGPSIKWCLVFGTTSYSWFAGFTGWKNSPFDPSLTYDPQLIGGGGWCILVLI